MIQKEADISETSKISILQPLDQEAGASMTAAMSDDEIICGCNGVSKGAIIQAIQEKGHDINGRNQSMHRGIPFLRRL